MTDTPIVDTEVLREQVARSTGLSPSTRTRAYHFHTGRPLAAGSATTRRSSTPCPTGRGVLRRYRQPVLAAHDPARRAGRRRRVRRRVRQLRRRPPRRPGGCGRRGRHDHRDARQGHRTAEALELTHVEFRYGLAEDLPVEDGWADVVISNGVINLCADKRAVFDEIHRVLRPGGVLQFADIANGRTVPIEAMRDVDLWTG